MTPSNTEDLRGAGARYLQLQAIALGLALVSGAYLFALNRNVLFLSFLASTYIACSPFFTRYPAMFACLGFFAFLAIFPAKIPAATFVEPVVEKREFINGGAYIAAPTSGAWQYEFDVVGLEGHQRECGGTLKGNLVIDGFGLDGLILEAGGKSIPTTSPKPFYNGQQLLVPLDAKMSGKFVVTLQGMPKTPARMSFGTEAHGSRIYGDAVWLEFTNKWCAVLYHARRRVLAAFPAPR